MNRKVLRGVGAMLLVCGVCAAQTTTVPKVPPTPGVVKPPPARTPTTPTAPSPTTAPKSVTPTTTPTTPTTPPASSPTAAPTTTPAGPGATPAQNPGTGTGSGSNNQNQNPNSNQQQQQQQQQPIGQPGMPVQPANPAAPKIEWPKVTEGPYLQKTQPREWFLQVILDVASAGSPDPAFPAVNSAPFVFDSMTIVWPVVGSTGNSEPILNGAQSWLRFEGREVMSGPFAKETTAADPRPVLLRTMANGELYPSGVMLGKWTWERPGAQTRTVQLQVEIPSTSYRTVFDDVEAAKVGWPTGPWPEVATATFQPEMFIDCGIDPITFQMKMYDMKPIRQAVAEWTQNNPKAMPPSKLAKYLTFKVVHGLIPGRADFTWGTPRQAFMGMDLLGAPLALQTRQVGVRDMGTVLVAVLREAGLPARLVYGFQGYSLTEDGNQSIIWTPQQRLRCWVEFCLYDEAKRTMNWVPIDYDRFRFTSTAMQNLNDSWHFFGTLQYANDMIPVALQAFPPTTVMAYGYPALWGWVMQPGVPVNVGQAVTISASRRQTDPKSTRPNSTNLPPNR